VNHCVGLERTIFVRNTLGLWVPKTKPLIRVMQPWKGQLAAGGNDYVRLFSGLWVSSAFVHAPMIVRGAFHQLLKPGLRQAFVAQYMNDPTDTWFVRPVRGPADEDPRCAWPMPGHQPEDWPEEPGLWRW
jgi:hypothetical protein